MFFDLLPSPLGELIICADDSGITAVAFPGEIACHGAANPNALVRKAVAQLQEYFAGLRTAFDLPLHAGTFSARGLAGAARRSYGATASYGDIAVAIGNPRASRAVGWPMAATRLLS